MPDTPQPLVGTISAEKVNVVGSVTGNVYTGNVYTGNVYNGPVDKTAIRNRDVVLRRVRADWITGLLRHSLANVASLELDLTSDSAAVAWSLAGIVQPFDSEPQTIPPGTLIATLFDQYEGALLILGDPGAGKTTLLLQLAESLLDRAIADLAHPIPIVFNLSGWAVTRKPLDQWLIAEMNLRTDIPRALATEWINKGNILPLLDGLDEVDPTHRDACLVAINLFRANHGLVPIAVCSRTADYAQLHGKLRLRAAVIIEPLTAAHVEGALAAAPELAALRQSVGADPALADMLRTPLMLWIAVMACRGASRPLTPSATPELARAQLFESYVQAMFQRKAIEGRTRANTLRALVHLARAMTAQRLTLFSLEALAPSLEYRPRLKFLAYLLTAISVVILYAVICFFVCGAGYGISGLIINLLTHYHLLARRPVVWSEQWMATQAISEFSFYVSVAACLFVTLFGKLRATDAIDFSRHKLGTRVLPAFLTSLSLFVLLYIAWAEEGELSLSKLVSALKESVTLDGFGQNVLPPLTLALIGGFFRLLLVERPSGRSMTNQGTRRSALVATCLLLATLGSGFIFSLKEGLMGWLILAPILSGLGGGFFVLHHCAARLSLWITRFGPLRYGTFLDQATHCIFLTQVGGGHVFKHRLLQEHLAQQSLDSST